MPFRLKTFRGCVTSGKRWVFFVYNAENPEHGQGKIVYYCQPDVRNSHKFVILNYLANSCTVWLQFLDAYYRPFSDGIPTVFVDEGGFLASYLFRWLSRLPKNNNQTITTVN